MKIRFGLYLAALPLVLQSTQAFSCATVDETPHPEKTIAITDESAVILWDAAKKREHFIRTARFKGDGKDVGFIVPSPTVPELAGADQAAFEVLNTATAPRVVKKTEYNFRWSLLFEKAPLGAGEDSADREMTKSAEPEAKSAPEVQVLQTRKVAGYDATTIKADDPKALDKWLHKKGYAPRADLADWLKPYVREGWVVTAFKITKGNRDEDTFDSSLVRMSFDTPKPFYPYREPAGQRGDVAKRTPRSLRVYFLGNERMAAAIGDATKRAWPGEAKWSDNLDNHLNVHEHNRLAKLLALPEKQVPRNLRMTSYEDRSYPRPGFDDLYFEPSKQQETFLPPPIVQPTQQNVLIPLDLIFVGGVLLMVVGRAVKSKKVSG